MPHLALLLLVALPSRPLGAALVDDARVIGVPYDLAGRLRDPDDGLDCQGSVFFAAERVGPCQPVIAGLGALVVDDGVGQVVGATYTTTGGRRAPRPAGAVWCVGKYRLS